MEHLDGLRVLVVALARAHVMWLVDPDQIEIVAADDDTPSLVVPLGEYETLLITPEPERQVQFAMVLLGSQGVAERTLRRNVTAEEAFSFFRARADHHS